ncbi:hypothetical protein V3C99_012431 [Haemonchus contortus]
MAFGGLLDSFLAENDFDAAPRGRRHQMQSRRSATIGTDMSKFGMKKLSTTTMPSPKLSWPIVREGAIVMDFFLKVHG